MAVSYSLIYSDTTTIPSNSGALTFNGACNLAGGPVDEFIIRITTANTTNAILADFGNIMNSLRIIENGSTFFDFRSGYADASNNAASQFGYFLNSMGAGRAVEVPGDTSKEVYYRIPCGRQFPASVSRLEWTLSYAGTDAAVASGTFQIYARYNSAMTQTTTVSASTSFTHAVSEEQVVVRLPQGIPGTVAGIMVQNDSAADQLTGIRVVSQSDWSLPPEMFKAFNGDLWNGVVYADDDVSTTEQQYAVTCAGGLFLPLFDLSMEADVVLTVNSSAATTRTYTPVIVAPVNSGQESRGTQTQAVVTSTSASVLDATTETA